MGKTLQLGISTFALTLLTLAWSPKLFAQDKGSQFGLVYGFSVPDADNTNPFKLSGIKGVTFIHAKISLGGYWYLSDRSGAPSETDKFQYSLHGVQTAFHMKGSKGDTNFALRAGLTKVRNNSGTTDMTFSPAHYGVAAGYDFFINAWLSYGFEGSYVKAMDAKVTAGGVEFEREGFNIVTFLAVIQMKF